MAIDGHRSTFAGGGVIDGFQEQVDLSPSEITSAQRWQILKLKNDKNSSEIEEFNTLTTQLSNKIFSAESYNRLADCIVALEKFFSENVEGYIATKQTEFDNTITTKTNEITTLITTKSNEFDATLSNFSDKNNWSNVISYKMWNTVSYNYETYMSLTNNNLNHIPDESNSLYWRRIAQRGATGVGIGLTPMGVYNNSVTYLANQAITYNGSIYYALQSTVGNLPTNQVYWALFQANMVPIIQPDPPSSPVIGQVWIQT